MIPNKLPSNLIEALRGQECALFTGSDLSVAAGYPAWASFVRELLDWGLREKIIEPRFGESLEKSISGGEPDFAADSLASQAERSGRHGELVDILKSRFLTPQLELTPIHQSLGKIPFTAAVTPNYDDLIERAFSYRFGAVDSSVVFTPLDNPEEFERMQQAHKDRRFFILKLRGWLDRPETVILSTTQGSSPIYVNRSAIGRVKPADERHKSMSAVIEYGSTHHPTNHDRER